MKNYALKMRNSAGKLQLPSQVEGRVPLLRYDTNVIICDAEFIILNAEFIIYDAEFIILNAEFIICDAEFIILNAEFIICDAEFIV